MSWSLGSGAHVWTRIDYFAKFPGLREARDYGSTANRELHAALLEVYGCRLCDELAELLSDGQNRAAPGR